MQAGTLVRVSCQGWRGKAGVSAFRNELFKRENCRNSESGRENIENDN
jgi:hypothetical protein